MGTNFYFYSAGGNDEMPTHIGKSNGGWVFALRIYPENGINDLNDWVRFFDAEEGRIFDVYHREIPVPEMISTITNRGWDPEEAESRWEKHQPWGYPNLEAFHRENCSMRGPRGLLRHQLGQFSLFGKPTLKVGHDCFTHGFVKHGEGTWDCYIGEFS